MGERFKGAYRKTVPWRSPTVARPASSTQPLRNRRRSLHGHDDGLSISGSQRPQGFAPVSGAMMFGGETDEATSRRIIDRAFDPGLNFLDTADVYHAGRPEEIVGRAIAQRRDDWVVATKFGYPASATARPNEQGQSRKWICQTVDASLKRLSTDYIDVLYFHRSLNDAPLEEGRGDGCANRVDLWKARRRLQQC